MNHFLIARHGKTINNQLGRLSGHIDTPLTSDGLEPTEKVIKKLDVVHIDHIYSSDLGRAFITAYEIARAIGYDNKITRLAGLREVNYGDAANMLRNEAYAKYPLLDRNVNFKPSGGQSLSEMQQVVFQAIEEINTQHDDQTILIVAHSGVMAALNSGYLGDDFGRHNISEAYEHDVIGEFQFANLQVMSYKTFNG